MADRTSAGIFGKLFQLLAKNPTEEHKDIAREMYNASSEYDFAKYQMYADDALVELGLAKKGVDPKHPEEGEVILYE